MKEEQKKELNACIENVEAVQDFLQEWYNVAELFETAAKAGVTAIIQPGGAMRDQLSIDKADEYGIAMVFTGMRHFRH